MSSTDTPMIRDGSQTVAAVDLSACQFQAVKITDDNAVNVASAGNLIYGILQNKPQEGQAADVAIFGLCLAICGAGGWTPGAKLKVGASGTLVVNSTGDTTVAVALATQVEGDQATVKIIPTAG